MEHKQILHTSYIFIIEMIYDIQRQSYQIASAKQLLIKFEYSIIQSTMTQIKENQQNTI